MPPKTPFVAPVLGLLILVAGPQADARGQAVGEPPLILRVGPPKAGSAEVRPVPNGLGDSSADLVYTPVAPCRVFDTRSAAAGMLTPDAPQDFLVAGTTGFAAQGGNPSGCAVPLGPATAVVLNLAVVNPAGPGHIRAWAVADPTPPAPFASVLNFGNVAGLQALANAVVLPICDRAGGACAADLRLETFASSAHVVGDVLGYFRSGGLTADLLVGSDGFGPVVATAGSPFLGLQEVLTPGRFVDCVVTCSFTVSSAAPNVTGHASVQGGAKLVGSAGAVFGGMPMFAAPVASAGASSATQTAQIGLGASLRFQFGCFVAAGGDFLGDEITGTVGWVCR
jgi:hypothetical protein